MSAKLLFRSIWTFLVALSIAQQAFAQDYPTRPVRIIVPATAGGTIDIVARVVAQKLGELWSQQLIVDNRPGGGNTVGTHVAAKATPDGYTLLLSSNSLASGPALYKKLPYDTQRDLDPVVLIASQPMAIGAHPAFRPNSIKELVEVAKAAPGKLSYGAAGIGTAANLAMEILKVMANVDIVYVAYKGGNLAVVDVMANNIALVMTGLPNLLPLQRTGKIKILGISQPSAIAPDIPVIAESVPGYEFKNWFGFIAPARTPKPIIGKINADTNKVLKTTDASKLLLQQGFDIVGGTTQEFDQTLKRDMARFAKIIERTGIEKQ